MKHATWLLTLSCLASTLNALPMKNKPEPTPSKAGPSTPEGMPVIAQADYPTQNRIQRLLNKGIQSLTCQEKDGFLSLLYDKESQGFQLTSRETSIKKKLSYHANILPFNPRNYHAALNRYNVSGDATIHTGLQAMVAGTKGVFLASNDDLEQLSPQEKTLMEIKHIQKIAFRTNSMPDEDTTILYMESAREHAFALEEYLKNLAVLSENAYLIGKLLSYPEDDILYYYECRGKEKLFAQDKKEAETFFANKNLRF